MSGVAVLRIVEKSNSGTMLCLGGPLSHADGYASANRDHIRLIHSELDG
jgi:hypothetical protein